MRAAEDRFCRPVAEGDLVPDVGSDDAGVDRLEDVLHEGLEFRHLVEGSPHGCEQAGVLDRHGGLIGEGRQQVALPLGEQALAGAVLGVDQAGQLAFDLERYGQDRPQVVGDDALLSVETRVGLGVGREHGLPAARHALDQGAADLLLAGAERGPLPVARHLDVEGAGFAAQHQEGALGAGDADDGVDDLVEHDRQLERRVDDLTDLGQRQEVAALLVDVFDGAAQGQQCAAELTQRFDQAGGKPGAPFPERWRGTTPTGHGCPRPSGSSRPSCSSGPRRTVGSTKTGMPRVL